MSGREDFIVAVRRGIDPIIKKVTLEGYLPGRFYNDWEPASLSSCLTGSAQLALVCYRLGEVTGEPGYPLIANRLVNYLKSLQSLKLQYQAVNGAIAGSFPILGEYMRAGYPNWASKYFVDALMMQASLSLDSN